jgi:phage/plasmid-like protein (TIGR03299 family)
MRTTTWSNIGKEVKSTNIADVLRESGLDYNVITRPVMTKVGNQEILIPGKVATVNEATNEVFGVVSERYTVCQNSEAFDFVNNVEGVQFIKAGQTYTGMVYVIGKLPDITVLGDTFTPYLIFQNGHNGRYTVKTTICPLRIVCQNQFNYAFRESPNTISIQHSSQYVQKLAEAEKLIKGTAEYMRTFQGTAEELATLKIGTEANVQEIINSFFTLAADADDKQILKVEEQRVGLLNAYKADDNANFTGTAWGLINGFSDYVTHKDVKNTKNKDDSKFMTVTFDPRLFMAFVDHVKAFAR